ncbi:MAG: hypothetical protein GY861_00725 [bacterium]|nr:hypothetical protein [bacterium]
MKSVFLIVAFVFGCFSHVSAQDCTPYFPMEKGSEFEISSYKTNGKLTGSCYHKVLERVEDGSHLTVKVSNQSRDKKGNETANTEYVVECQEGIFRFDFSMFMNNESLQAYDNMETTITGKFLELPSAPKPGDVLNEGEMKVVVENAGIPFVTINIRVYDRKVDAIEARETPAGTFECARISYKVETTIGGIIPFTVKSSATEWYAKGVGLVRSENFNNNGKYLGYSELTMIKK